MNFYTNINSPASCYDYEQLTVSSTSVGLTLAKYWSQVAQGSGQATVGPLAKSASHVMITVEDATVRMRIDGTDPTSSVGHVMNPGDIIILDGYDNIRKVRFIRTTSTDAKVSVSYFRRG